MTKRVKAFKQAMNDCETANSTIDAINKKLGEYNDIVISPSLTIRPDSTDKQYLFGLGVLNSKMTASQELGLPCEDVVKDKEQILAMHKLNKELIEWKTYKAELNEYKKAIEATLTKLDKFCMLKTPVSPADK